MARTANYLTGHPRYAGPQSNVSDVIISSMETPRGGCSHSNNHSPATCRSFQTAAPLWDESAGDGRLSTGVADSPLSGVS